ncbi:peptidyl-prolyl cis-trans isomerase FKBP8 [Lingula anatina]|uniref:peptidylprolyl isomerase n=1 Tax=Lingula anatina TaxID=7574 RepID=A0A1S3HJH2_LINAN|nr:peptidyl-prolyl cis-trans isomerase FKBP8 [Lingula anatina]|eukprot:XP_013386268.1 peptidyl-prolyl cis-trans isomerase FKBP8 [Lingula anatina]
MSTLEPQTQELSSNKKLKENNSEKQDAPASDEYESTKNNSSTNDEVAIEGNEYEKSGINEEDQSSSIPISKNISSNEDNEETVNKPVLNGGCGDEETSQVAKEEDLMYPKEVSVKQNGATEDGGGDATKTETEEEGEERKEEHDGWMDILGNGLLKKKVLKKGDGLSSRPQRGQRPVISFSAHTEDGTVVDSETQLMITLGDCDVVQAMDLALSLMERGEVAEIVTDARFAYGSMGRDPDIPPNAQLTYEVELVRIEEPLDFEKLSMSERLEHGEFKKDKGNYWYSRQDYSSAINVYTKALKILDNSHNVGEGENSMRQKILDMRLKVYNNLAACQLKVEAYDAVLKSCNAVLKQQPNNVKALFRKGKAFEGNRQLGNAITSLRRALQLEPESKLIHQELKKLVERKKADDNKEQQMYRKMFGLKEDRNGKKKESWVSKNLLITGGAVLAAAVTVGIAVAVKSLNN